MEFIGFTYVTNFLSETLERTMFEVVDDANRLLKDLDLPLRFLYLDSLTLEPGYLITVETPEDRVRLYPLEVLVDFLDYRLKVELEKNDGITMNKILGLISFPLASRNRYFDFYESFLGFQAERLGRRIMVLSMRPFESDVLRMAIRTLESPNVEEDVKHLARRVLPRELETFKGRLLKGILHEVGHAFGLEHCSNPCVMNPPATIEEWDSRPAIFCDSCMKKLKESLGSFTL
ncbi:archaemetzincin [Thermococcus henrietii]|uniref:archaemetzincin n=1 Tax=Thermococcus henrietii TaxID=2016361 RepID=UPI000C077910|nr:archaemetzincin [Thermococcus henrietii]